MGRFWADGIIEIKLPVFGSNSRSPSMFSVGNPVDFGKIEERAVDLPIDKIGGGMSVKSTLGRILSWVNPNGISDENRIGIGALEDRIGRADFGRIGGCDRGNDQGEAKRYALRGSAAKR